MTVFFDFATGRPLHAVATPIYYLQTARGRGFDAVDVVPIRDEAHIFDAGKRPTIKRVTIYRGTDARLAKYLRSSKLYARCGGAKGR